MLYAQSKKLILIPTIFESKKKLQYYRTWMRMQCDELQTRSRKSFFQLLIMITLATDGSN